MVTKLQENRFFPRFVSKLLILGWVDLRFGESVKQASMIPNEPEIDLERVIHDVEYRRRMIERLLRDERDDRATRERKRSDSSSSEIR